MSNSNFRKKPNEKNLTRKMIQGKMDDMASLMVAMEATLMEWETWYRLMPLIKEGLSEEEFSHYLNDGPIFTDMPGKIMSSIREQMDKQEKEAKEKAEKAQNASPILDSNGNVVKSDDKPILLDSNEKPIV